jgi:hypothetical protein
MVHGLGHAEWARTWTCNIDLDMDMQNEHGHVALTWTAAWTIDMYDGHLHCKCSMNIDVDIQHGHRHAAWTWTEWTDV